MKSYLYVIHMKMPICLSLLKQKWTNWTLQAVICVRMYPLKIKNLCRKLGSYNVWAFENVCKQSKQKKIIARILIRTNS